MRAVAPYLLNSFALASLAFACTALVAANTACAQTPSTELRPPAVIDAPAPAYPEAERTAGRAADVELRLTLDAEGNLAEATIVRSAGQAFDAEALQSVWSWVFAPATRGGTPIPSTFNAVVHFDAPTPETLAGTASPPVAATASTAGASSAPSGSVTATSPAVTDAPPASTNAVEDAAGFAATGQVAKLPPPRGASEFVVERDVLEAAPHHEAADMLRAVPGVFIARPEGDAVAHKVTLRGFDADHGQDIAFTAAGVPLNQPSHIHGQGYTDLGFILPEAVRYIRVREGVYDPLQGDFAVAGSVDFDLAVERRGLRSRSTYGSFSTFRQLLLWAPEGQSDETFAGASYRQSDGFGQNRASRSGGAMAQYSFGDDWRVTMTGWVFGARAGSAGVLRREDIDAGLVDFHDTYPDATARAQSAFSSQAVLAAHLEHDGDDGSVTEAGLWVGTFNFRSKLNFTGYTRRSTFDPAWIGRGDLIEQHNADLALGFHARYRTPTYEPVEWAKGSIEFGLSTRVDNIDQQQNLLESPQNQTWDQLVDASITGADVGAWVDAHVDLTKYVQLHGGVRADALFYDVEDALGNFIPAIRRESYIVGFRRNAFGLAAGPRVSVTVAPVEWMKLIAAYGQGFRSPQARQLQDGETAPYTKVHSGDLGARFSFGRNEELTLTTAAYLTKLSDDVAFEPAEARVERIGPTTRVGGVFYATARPWRGWLSSLSVTYVHATLDAPPPATADNPTPAFQDGQLLPYVPPWVVRLDSKVEEPLFSLGDDAVYGSIGAGVSYLSPRPLPFSEFADPVALVDASMGARWRNLELNIEAYNLFNSSYAASEYSFVSNWDPGAAPSRLPARHVAAGAPFTLLASLGVRL